MGDDGMARMRQGRNSKVFERVGYVLWPMCGRCRYRETRLEKMMVCWTSQITVSEMNWPRKSASRDR